MLVRGTVISMLAWGCWVFTVASPSTRGVLASTVVEVSGTGVGVVVPVPGKVVPPPPLPRPPTTGAGKLVLPLPLPLETVLTGRKLSVVATAGPDATTGAELAGVLPACCGLLEVVSLEAVRADKTPLLVPLAPVALPLPGVVSEGT